MFPVFGDGGRQFFRGAETARKRPDFVLSDIQMQSWSHSEPEGKGILTFPMRIICRSGEWQHHTLAFLAAGRVALRPLRERQSCQATSMGAATAMEE